MLVEGESLLNDGLFEILLLAALGTSDVGVASGLADFLYVFLGGAALGGVLGLATAELAARLGRLPSTALTIAVAYGAFALADGILGFSGVIATVMVGLVLSAFSNTLIPREEAQTWEAFWESIAFVANGILFVLIGLVIDAGLIADNLGSIAIGVGAVIVSRPLAILPVMPLVDRMSRTPNVGLRNQAVVVWGGLRGGVALALALRDPPGAPRPGALRRDDGRGGPRDPASERDHDPPPDRKARAESAQPPGALRRCRGAVRRRPDRPGRAAGRGARRRDRAPASRDRGRPPGSRSRSMPMRTSANRGGRADRRGDRVG